MCSVGCFLLLPHLLNMTLNYSVTKAAEFGREIRNVNKLSLIRKNKKCNYTID